MSAGKRELGLLLVVECRRLPANRAVTRGARRSELLSMRVFVAAGAVSRRAAEGHAPNTSAHAFGMMTLRARDSPMRAG